MINNLLRYCLSLLSFFYKNNLNKLKSHHNLISSEIINKLKKFSFTKSSRLKTHKIFSKTVYELILQNKTLNFLRNIKVQNIFFIHNRLFIFKELKEIQKDKIMWSLWKKLLIENDIGDPVRYFLYPKSSGNRIREVFHLLNFENFAKLSLNNVKTIFEFGGGYGNMARIFYKIDKNINYTIFDTFHVNLLQYYYLNMLKIPSNLNRINKKNITLNYKSSKCNFFKEKKKKLFIANWSLSESPIKLRNIILKKITNFDFVLISYQEKFEKINNHKFFSNISKKFDSKKFIIQISEIPFMNFFLSSNKNYYLFIKKIN